MNQLEIALHHHQLLLTEKKYSDFQSNLEKNQLQSEAEYLIQEKINDKSWITTYRGLSKKTKKAVLIRFYDFTPLINKQIRINRIQYCNAYPLALMKIKSQNVVKCYDCFENENYKIQFIEYCNEKSLYEILQVNKEIFPEQTAIKYIKQIVYGLSELYKQKIFLPQISLKKIFLHDGVCKITGFQFIQSILQEQQQNEMNVTDILKNHVFFLSKIFYTMIFGSENANQENKLQILQQISKQLNGANLSYGAKQFILSTLLCKQSQRISWKQFIKLDVFNKDTLNSDKFFKTLQKIKFQQQSKEMKQRKAKQQQYLKVLNSQDQFIYNWDKNAYLNIMKAQIILDNIINKINKQLFDLTARKNIEMMHLLCSRCLNNLNYLDQIKQEQKEKSVVLKVFKDKIISLKAKLQELGNFYRTQLTSKYNEKIFKSLDFITKSILRYRPDQTKRKQRILSGFENPQQFKQPNGSSKLTENNKISQENEFCYSKAEQIQFTVEYLNKSLAELQYNFHIKRDVTNYMKHYKQICEIKFEDLQSISFYGKLESILNESNVSCISKISMIQSKIVVSNVSNGSIEGLVVSSQNK